MSILLNNDQEENDFLFEEIDRYKLTITIDNKTSYTTSNDIDYLKDNYDNIITENLNNDRDIIISIFDYNKNTDIYSYNSEYEK